MPDRRILVALTLLAAASRLVWALVVHPTRDFIFKDMSAYVTHAQRLIAHGFDPDRTMAFVAWGTHTLLAAPLALFGADAFVPAAILWALLGAAAVPLTYLLACRVCSSPRIAALVGLAALLWYPNLAYSGLFLSETPLLCFLTAAVWRLVVLIQDGRGALSCGLLCAVCFALRPEVALGFALVLGLWLVLGPQRRAATPRHVLLALLPGVLALAFSLWHFHRHTGRWGLAESARANLTPARCHHPWVQAFDRPAELARGPDLKGGRIYGVVYFFELRERGDRWFGLHPAFGTTKAALEIDGPAGPFPVRVSKDGISLQFVGHRADPQIHAAIQRACITRTGWLGQLKISLSNLAGLWFFNHQWPDSTRGGEPFLPWSNAFIHLFRWLVWIPSLLGVAWSLRHARQRPGLAVCALPLVGLLIVAAIWFGEIRLRTPYDPLALLLAAEAYALVARTITGSHRHAPDADLRPSHRGSDG